MAPRHSSRSRPPLSPLRILKAAVSYADEHGVETLTMRKVADALGCGVMSLYNHVANKDEMLFGMVDVVVADIVPPVVAGEGWKDTMRASAALANEVLLKHPWAAAEWMRRFPGPERMRYQDSILRVLTEADLGPELVYHGYHAVTMHIVGFTLQQVAYLQAFDDDFEELAEAAVESMADSHPYMAEHVRAHLDGDDHGDEFRFVLDLLLDGLERAARASS